MDDTPVKTGPKSLFDSHDQATPNRVADPEQKRLDFMKKEHAKIERQRIKKEQQEQERLKKTRLKEEKRLRVKVRHNITINKTNIYTRHDKSSRNKKDENCLNKRMNRKVKFRKKWADSKLKARN